jgi:class 3 adenylate cyclase
MQRSEPADVFILMTVIAQSSRLAESYPSAYQILLKQHSQLVEQLVAAEGGRVYKKLGDGYICLFPAATAAVNAAHALTRETTQFESFEDERIVLRTTVNCGPLRAIGHEYTGAALSRASRIGEICHPGQILLTHDIVSQLEQLPESTTIEDIGVHLLRELEVEEHLYQLSDPACAARAHCDLEAPELCWNTHLACMERLAGAVSQPHDLVDVAGLTGLAFRNAWCQHTGPQALYFSWAWVESFREWFELLGLDVDIAIHNSEHLGFSNWLQRQVMDINSVIGRGLPVMFWDSLGFNIIAGRQGGTYLTGKVDPGRLHPIWHTHPGARPLIDRWDSEDPLVPVGLAGLQPRLEPDALFVMLHGVTRYNIVDAAYLSLYAAVRELEGVIAYPRHKDDILHRTRPQYGQDAYRRLMAELKEGNVDHFGLVQGVQSTYELRLLAWKYLKRVASRVEPQYEPRILQAAEFMHRICKRWQSVAPQLNVPLDPTTQLAPRLLGECAAACYDISRTEDTLARLIRSIVTDVFAL